MIITGATIVGARVVDGSVLTNNLLIWLDANNASSYSGTGTTVNDLSGNGYTHTLTSAGIYTVLNGVKCFDCSTTGEVYVNGTGPLLPTTGFTYICWGRLLNSTAGYRTLWRTTPEDHPILIEVGNNRMGMWDNAGGNFQYSGYTATGLANAWVHFAVTGTNTSQTFYINGQQVGTTAYGAGGNRHNEWGSTGGLQPFGYVANMFLYNTILTAEQIQQNYYGSRRNFGILSYTSTGSTTWVAPLNVTQVQYLVVGGGGGGGNGYDTGAGGGGGAGMVLTGNIDVTPGTSYTVTVGDGGAGGAGTYPGSYNGSAGNNSVFATITSLGGGLGWGSRQQQSTIGAAQVGSSTAATGGGGGGSNAGGAGGGGSIGAGSDNSGTTGGAGGAGTSSNITGSSVTYGAGGKGGNSGSGSNGAAGTANSGNGGGGANATSSGGWNGGKGGSGIVVLRYNQE